MKIALAQINPTVGDFAGNARLILDFTARAAKQTADLVVFPELAICGYPPADLLEKSSFLAPPPAVRPFSAVRPSPSTAIPPPASALAT
jgi:predicted amidohydrolase